jgi:hypothetical protein
MGVYRIRDLDYDTGATGELLAELVVSHKDPTEVVKISGYSGLADAMRMWQTEGQNAPQLLGGLFGSTAIEYDENDEESLILKEEGGIEAHGEVSKIDEDRQLVFGWAYVTHDKDGKVSVDKSGEFVDDYEEIEKAAYDFVIRSRAGDADHTNVKGSEMVESMVFTPEKIAKMGIPEGTIPTGWWVGFKVEDAELWKSVKDGKRMAFSIHGKGTRKEIDE